MDNAQSIIDDLHGSGFRMTGTRKNLIDFFCNTKHPVSAEEILIQQAAKGGFTAHKVTVYRELDFLTDRGIIRAVDFGDRKKRYELALRKHHHHIVCNKCKRVQDVVIDRHLEKEIKHIQKTRKFKIVSHSLEFFGLCAECR